MQNYCWIHNSFPWRRTLMFIDHYYSPQLNPRFNAARVPVRFKLIARNEEQSPYYCFTIISFNKKYIDIILSILQLIDKHFILTDSFNYYPMLEFFNNTILKEIGENS